MFSERRRSSGPISPPPRGITTTSINRPTSNTISAARGSITIPINPNGISVSRPAPVPPTSSNISTSPFHFITSSASSRCGSGRSSSRSRRQRRSRSRRQRHQNNMPLNLLGVDRRDVWRTCFCFHVRTVTIFIGVWYLMVYILGLSLIAAMVMYETNNDGLSPASSTISSDQHQPLPTPVSKIADSDTIFAEPRSAEEAPREKMENWKNGPLVFFVDSKRATSQYALLTICNMLITLLMVYGAVRGKPSYLMPFFVLKVFDFCIFCLTMVGYFSYLPNVTEMISEQPGLPFRDELLRMDPQLLSLLTLILIVGWISLKAYVIGVIWNCYKYLMLRNTVIRGVISYRHDDPSNILGMQQNLLPDLPDYETAMNDPRYAKKPPLDGTNITNNNMSVPNSSTVGPVTTMAIPPPPYSVAISTTNTEQIPPPQEQPSVTSIAETITETIPTSTTTTSPSSIVATNAVKISMDEYHFANDDVVVSRAAVNNSPSSTTTTTSQDSAVAAKD